MTDVTYRVLVSTDLGGDPDDIQSLVHLLHYSDILRVEGILSTTGPGSTPRAALIREWVQRVDLGFLRARGYPELMAEDDVLPLVVQGATELGAAGPGADTYPNYYADLDAPAEVCQATINRWRVDYLRDWKTRWLRHGWRIRATTDSVRAHRNRNQRVRRGGPSANVI